MMLGLSRDTDVCNVLPSPTYSTRVKASSTARTTRKIDRMGIGLVGGKTPAAHSTRRVSHYNSPYYASKQFSVFRPLPFSCVSFRRAQSPGPFVFAAVSVLVAGANATYFPNLLFSFLGEGTTFRQVNSDRHFIISGSSYNRLYRVNDPRLARHFCNLRP